MWVPSFSLLSHPLYEAVLGHTHEPLLKPITKPFQRLQQALLKAPALHLPDLTCPFSLYITEKKGFALGDIGQQLLLHPKHTCQKTNKPRSNYPGKGTYLSSH